MDPGERETLLWHLQNAVTLAAKQDTIVWAVFSVFTAGSGALLVAMFPGGDDAALRRAVLAVVGAVGSAFWAIILNRAMGYFRYYEAQILRLEARLQIPAELSLASRPDGHSNRTLMVSAVWVIAGAWAVAFVILARL